jgi:CBS domain-containing protein
MRLAERPVSEVMQREVATLRIDDRLDLAEDIMRLGRVRHMPVLDGERLVGVVSNRDLLAAGLTRVLDFEPSHRRTFLRTIEVREVMSKELISVAPETPLAGAARLMIERQIGCLPVVKQAGVLLGMVTETDLLRAAFLDEQQEEVDVATHELDELRRVRDELGLKLHLAKADARDLWEHLERRFGELELHVRRSGARGLIDELRRGYRELRERL